MTKVSMNPLAERLLPRPPMNYGKRQCKVYIAGRYEDQPRLRQFALDMEREQGWQTVASWLWSPETREQAREMGTEDGAARQDLTEIRQCDVLILDTLTPTETGGRDFEAGFAMALGKIVLRRGPSWNIFHTLLPEVEL